MAAVDTKQLARFGSSLTPPIPPIRPQPAAIRFGPQRPASQVDMDHRTNDPHHGAYVASGPGSLHLSRPASLFATHSSASTNDSLDRIVAVSLSLSVNCSSNFPRSKENRSGKGT